MKSTDLSSYNNSWYKQEIGGSVIKRAIWYYINSIFFSSAYFPFNRLKRFCLLMFGSKIGKNVVIKPLVSIKYPWKLVIGNNTWIGENVWIDNLALVTIGNNVCVSQGAMLLTGNHDFSKSTFDLMVSPIVLEDGVWIGAKCTVCPGVKAFTHSVLLANSVATKHLEAYSIYQGNPAIKIKERIIR